MAITVKDMLKKYEILYGKYTTRFGSMRKNLPAEHKKFLIDLKEVSIATWHRILIDPMKIDDATKLDKVETKKFTRRLLALSGLPKRK